MEENNNQLPPEPRRDSSDPTRAQELQHIREEKLSFMEDFKRRIRQTKTTRWIRFAIVSLLFCGFEIWLGNP